MIHCPHCGQPAGSHEPASMVDPASGEAEGLSYRDLFEANRAVMLLIDPDSERIVDANPAAVSFYGYPENVLKGMKITDINTLPPDSTRKRIKKAQKAAQTIFRFQHRLASGGIRTVEVFSSPIQINRRTMLFSIIHDISEEVNAQKAQKATESLLHSVFDSSPDLMLLIDRDLRIVLSNWKGREFVPLSKRGHRPRCHQVFMNRQTPCDPCLALEVFKTGAPKIYERFNPNPAVGHIEVHAYPVLDDRGNVALVAEHVRDINNRKAAEREKAVLRSKLYQAQRMESIGTLAGGIAHDFNNILMAILGNVSLMKAEIQTGSAVTESLDHLEDYVRRGSELTRQLLGFARGGKYEVTPSNLGDILAKSTDMFGRTRKDIRIDVEQAPDVVSVDIDRGQIDQVFLNILLNAGQAMPDGGDIFVRIRNVDLNDAYCAPYGVVPGTYARVSITDTGIGMDEKTKDRIFDPFFTTKGIGEGTGLGLASAYGIVKNHGGIINVYSEPGQGSTFMVYLPAGSKDG
ncbi:MAG: PAS domain S-box protein, partial [Desulfobacterales bacterium]